VRHGRELRVRGNGTRVDRVRAWHRLVRHPGARVTGLLIARPMLAVGAWRLGVLRWRGGGLPMLLAGHLLARNVLTGPVLARRLLARCVLSGPVLSGGALAGHLLAGHLLAGQLLAGQLLARCVLAVDLLARKVLSRGALGWNLRAAGRCLRRGRSGRRRPGESSGLRSRAPGRWQARR
jgi:hypothetical protein